MLRYILQSFFARVQLLHEILFRPREWTTDFRNSPANTEAWHYTPILSFALSPRYLRKPSFQLLKIVVSVGIKPTVLDIIKTYQECQSAETIKRICAVHRTLLPLLLDLLIYLYDINFRASWHTYSLKSDSYVMRVRKLENRQTRSEAPQAFRNPLW